MPTPFIHHFNVALYDVDPAGVIFFANIYRRAFDAGESLFLEMGFPIPQILRERRFITPVVHSECDYLAPLRYGDGVDVEVRVAEVRERSFALEYLFSVGETLCAKVKTVHAVTDPEVQCAQLIPDDLREALLARAAPSNVRIPQDSGEPDGYPSMPEAP